jgi:hypothetical protein
MEQELIEDIPDSTAAAGMDVILLESVDRKLCVEDQWLRARKRYIERHPGCGESDVAVPFSSVKRWITHERIVSSEFTHYAVIMDPKRGEVVWAERYPVPEYESEGENEDESEVGLLVSVNRNYA